MLIGRLARLTGLSKDGIRHYEEIGIIRSTERRTGSRTYRDYDPACVARIEHARQAQRLGLTLREIGPVLDAHGGRVATRAETLAFLEERLAVTRARIEDLREVKRFIVAKLAGYAT